MTAAPSVSNSITVRLELPARATAVSELTTAIERSGGLVTGLDVTASGPQRLRVDVPAAARDQSHAEDIVAAMRAVHGVEIGKVSDRTFLVHLGGKLTIESKVPIRNRDDLSLVYTPGVARVCMAIAENPEDARRPTIRRNAAAVVTDGSAVLGLGNIGPLAALPVMEGKAALFKRFAGIDAFPICLDTQDVDEIVETVVRIAPVFAGINLEDISAPRCFEVEARLRERLDIPVFHDDQHGTAIVVLAALTNALKVVGKRLEEIKIVTTGCGAAGTAVTKILVQAGARRVVGCDEGGALYRGRAGLSPAKQAYAESTNPENERGSADEGLAGADVFIGVSVPGAVTRAGIASMAPDAIVFALANPRPEIDLEEIEDCVAILASGRSDYPNQINNLLAFPGVFRGALDARATTITAEMKIAAAHALAEAIPPDELSVDYIVPSVFDRSVAHAVAKAVAAAALSGEVSRPVAPA